MQREHHVRPDKSATTDIVNIIVSAAHQHLFRCVVVGPVIVNEVFVILTGTIINIVVPLARGSPEI